MELWKQASYLASDLWVSWRSELQGRTANFRSLALMKLPLALAKHKLSTKTVEKQPTKTENAGRPGWAGVCLRVWQAPFDNLFLRRFWDKADSLGYTGLSCRAEGAPRQLQ